MRLATYAVMDMKRKTEQLGKCSVKQLKCAISMKRSR